MLPSMSLAMSDSTTQTAGPQAAATAPVFTTTHQIGEGNSANPSASASAAAGAPSTSANGIPAWLLPAGAGLAVLFMLVIVMQRKAQK